jgi:DNA-binding transcriptional LysR family regulator
MNLRAIDLNLLTVLDALLDEAHVSRAGDRLGLSQPAASAALDRCRVLFGDPLLERGRGTMRRTPRAESLRAPVRAILREVERLIDPPEPDLAGLRQSIRLVMADHPAIMVVPGLLADLARTAPGITLVLQPWYGADAALEAMARGTTDLALSVFPRTDPSFHRETVSHEAYIVAMRPDHPAAASFDLDRWLDYPHVLVSGQGATRGPLDDALEAHGLARTIGAVVPSFAIVPSLLAGSDLIALLPRRALPPEPHGLVVFEPPVAVEGFPLHLAWHMRRDRDPGVRHIAALIRGRIETDVG